MGGGTLQLVATGGQDIYLIGNPSFSFFSSVYRKHTNFSIECIKIESYGNDESIDYEIQRNGDLLNKMHFEIDLPEQDISNDTADETKYCNYTNSTAYSYIDTIRLEIGGELIDQHSGKWLDIKNELTHDDKNHNYIINKSAVWPNRTYNKPQKTKLYVPLGFWFCKGYSESLPLISLQYHKVSIKAKFRNIYNIINSDQSPNQGAQFTGPPLKPEISLWGNYIHLDTDERKRFAQGSHEYLIEQVQEIKRTYSPSIYLSINHPVKSLYWVIQNKVAASVISDLTSAAINPEINFSSNQLWVNSNDVLNYGIHEQVNRSYLRPGSVSKYEHFKTATFLFNGIERFEPRDATYFRTIQPGENNYKIPEKNIYMYSFCLKPEDHQPSGSCNFSLIDNLTMEFTGDQSYTGYDIIIYAVNYNILRIMSGFGGLLYSN